MLARFWLVVTLFVLAACSGDGGGNPVTPPSGLSYPAAPTLVVGQSMAAVTPTVTGNVTGYSVTPALPAGLTLNTTSGVISGTPTSSAATASYTVTATNSGGSTSAAVSLTVNDTAPNISYSQSQVDLTSGVPTTLAAQNSGGAVTLWAINPALPAGLSFDTSNGTISGSPNATSAPAQYTVTAQNSGGSDTFSLTLGVNSGVLLKLGHSQAIRSIAQSAGRVLSLDDYGFWTLWNSQTAEIVASGRAECSNLASCGFRADLKGSTFIIRHAATTAGPWLFEVRAASDGRVLSTFTKTAVAEMPPDGSYVAIRGSDNLTVQSPTGTVLFTRNGDYSAGQVFAAPTEIRAAAGPAGANTIEKISVPAGVASTSAPFQGTFHSWFGDGDRFLTNAGSTIWVYSHDVQQLDLRALPGIERLTGQGDWFWIHRSSTLSIYSVGASATPAASYSVDERATLIPVGDAIGVLRAVTTTNQFSVIDLSGAAPGRIDLTASIGIHGAFAVDDDGWLVANVRGSLVGVPSSGGTEKRFSLGATSSIVASANRIAVGLVEGPIIYFNAQTREEEGRINETSAELALSSDGTVLAMRRHGPVVKIFSLPSGSEIETLTYPWYVYSLGLSASGQHIATWTHERLSDRREVTEVGTGGAAVLYSDTGMEPPLKLSPTGRIAAPNFTPASGRALTTNIYQGNSLTGAVSGYPAVWLDDNRLLIHRYAAMTGDGYSDSVIVGPTGAVSQTLVFAPRFTEADPADGQNIYVPEHNIILSLSTGQTVWSSVNTVPRGTDRSKRGAVTDTDVVFVAGSDVRIEPY